MPWREQAQASPQRAWERRSVAEAWARHTLQAYEPEGARRFRPGRERAAAAFVVRPGAPAVAPMPSEPNRPAGEPSPSCSKSSIAITAIDVRCIGKPAARRISPRARRLIIVTRVLIDQASGG